VGQGAFREDLYYRLNVVNIHVPPLRERREEIRILAEHFLQKYSRQYNRTETRVSRELLERFQAYTWPGNVRELENLIKRIVLLESEEFVTQEMASRGATHNGAAAEPAPAGVADEGVVASRKPAQEAGSARGGYVAGMGLKEVAKRAVHEAERGVIKEVLEEVRWNRVEAARRLKISYKALLYKIAMYELDAAGGKKISLNKNAIS
jgi:two-component system response regulator AtoC